MQIYRFLTICYKTPTENNLINNIQAIEKFTKPIDNIEKNEYQNTKSFVRLPHLELTK